MDQLVVIVELALLYLIMLIPQLRLVHYKYDPHIGNFTACRISGLSLSSIFFRHNYGVPVTALSLALQWDHFGSRMESYKRFHAVVVAVTGPLFYLFAAELLGNERAAFLSALIYAISFSMPVVGNWLIQCEQYENILFLAGGSLLLAAGGSPACSALGALILGCCLLCKFPALLSVWLMAGLSLKLLQAGEFRLTGIMAACYLAPLVLYLAVGRILVKAPEKRRGGFLETLKGVPERYLYFYRRDPAEYIRCHVTYHLTGSAKQLLPVYLLAASFLLLGSHPEKRLIVSGLAFVALIFPLRISFAVPFSFNVVLCLAAGIAPFSLPDGMATPVALAAALAAGFSLYMGYRDPTGGCYRRQPQQANIYQALGNYLREHSSPSDRVFCNVNSSSAFIYPLSERSLPCPATFLTIGGYGPYIDNDTLPPMIVSEGMELLAAFAADPPRYIMQSTQEYPILNLPALQYYCGLTYGVEAVTGPFFLLRLRLQREGEFEPEKVDPRALFDARQGLSNARECVSEFLAALAQKEKEEAPVAAAQTQPVRERLCLFLNVCPDPLLDRVYRDRPERASLGYAAQLDMLRAETRGACEFRAEPLRQTGWQAEEVVVNCRELQGAWAREHGSPCSDLAGILLEQARHFRPEVIYLQDIGVATTELLRELRRNCTLLAGEHAATELPQLDLSLFDTVFTPLPGLEPILTSRGVSCRYRPPAFDPGCIAAAASYPLRGIEVSCIGAPQGDVEFLELLAAGTPAFFWGEGGDALPEGSPAAGRHQGEAQGMALYQVLKNSKIVVAASCDPTLPLIFQASGAGALVVTPWREELPHLFETASEVVAFRSTQECLELVRYYLAHPDQAQAIAAAGRRRTMGEHTQALRMAQTAAVFEERLAPLRGAGSPTGKTPITDPATPDHAEEP